MIIFIYMILHKIFINILSSVNYTNLKIFVKKVENVQTQDLGLATIYS